MKNATYFRIGSFLLYTAIFEEEIEHDYVKLVIFSSA